MSLSESLGGSCCCSAPECTLALKCTVPLERTFTCVVTMPNVAPVLRRRRSLAVDRNQAREAARPPNGSSQICPSAEGNQQSQQNRQNQQNQPLELVRLLLRSAESDLDLHLKHLRSSIDLQFLFLIPSVTAGLSRTALNNWAQTQTQNVPEDLSLLSSSQVSDVTNGNSSGSAILPAADPPSPTGPAVSGFRTRTGPRSNTKTASRLQNASRPAVGGAADKQNQNKETEGKNQAVVQLRRLLLQGNRRVEALATVIQHLFSAVTLTSFCSLLLPLPPFFDGTTSCSKLP